jgi:hypothetical protein
MYHVRPDFERQRHRRRRLRRRNAILHGARALLTQAVEASARALLTQAVEAELPIFYTMVFKLVEGAQKS